MFKISKKIYVLLTIIICFSIASFVTAEEATAGEKVIPILFSSNPGTGSVNTVNPDVSEYSGKVVVKYLGEKNIELQENVTTVLVFELSFESYNETMNECNVNLDPSNKFAGSKYMTLGKGKGQICFNDYVTYNVTGDFTLIVGKPIKIEMKLDLPDLPSAKIPFNLIGLSSDLPIQKTQGGLTLES